MLDKLFSRLRSPGERGWPVVAAATTRACRSLVLLPSDPKSQRFERDMGALGEAMERSIEPPRRLQSEVEETIADFAKWQQRAVDDLIGVLDSSMRELVSTLDDAILSGDEVADAAKQASRNLRYLDGGTVEELKAKVESEMTTLLVTVQEHARLSAEIHAKYAEDLEQMRKQLDDAQRVSRTDGLTKLPNRTAHEFYLHAALAKAKEGAPFALALLDLDDFKEINDELGHQAGDAALIAFGTKLKEAVGKDGFVARLSGDEFTVIFRGSAAQLQSKLERFKAILEENEVDLGEEDRCLEASFGVVDIEGSMSYTGLMKLVDEEMYASKRRERILKAAS